MAVFPLYVLVLGFVLSGISAQEIVNGQIFTPGLAIVDSPQPNTPEGGDFLQVALDVSADGKLQLPPYPNDTASAIWNITIFLSSYTTGWNFTITNGTASAGNASLGDIMYQEPGSTVKHVNWVWPDCLVGNGAPSGNGSARGEYNISIRQNFRINNTAEYTIFDLPIQVTNEIDNQTNRPSCDALNNPLLSESQLKASANNFTFIPGTPIQTGGSSSSSSSSGNGLGGTKPTATPGSGLGGAGVLKWQTAVHWLWLGTFAFFICH